MSKKDNTKKEYQLSAFFSAVKSIIKNDKNTDDKLTTGFFSILVSSFFKLLFIISILFDALFLITAFKSISDFTWHDISKIVNNIFVIVMIIVLAFLIFIFGVIFKGISNEIEKNDDKNYIISVFSAVTGFIALIVAIIALMRGIL